MDESSSDSESVHARVQQLEQERDELRKDIEQLCMQQAGPSYIAIATQMHFRRTAGLEQEIENLKKKLAACKKENSNVKEELSEAKRIKTHLDQLHKAEVAKNAEVNKQLEYIRGVVATAFSDRDHAIMEAEKAKENEDLMCQKVSDAEKRLQELTRGSIETQEQLRSLQIKLAEQDSEIEKFRKIINKFYKIRQHACGAYENEDSGSDNQSEDICWDDKFACLNNDPLEAWSFDVRHERSTANYIAGLQEQLESLRRTVVDYQNKLQMGWEIEKHLKTRVKILEQKKILSDRLIIDGISSLREYHSQLKISFTDLLNDEKCYLQSVAGSIEEKIEKLTRDTNSVVHDEESNASIPNINHPIDYSEALAQALHEKVSALLLLEQQDQRHNLEKSVHAAMQETLDEYRKILKQATEEKVNTLVKLALVEQDYQLLLEETKTGQGNLLANSRDRSSAISGRDGRLKNLWKKTSLKRWLGTEENFRSLPHPPPDHEESQTHGSSNRSFVDARLQIENATLKDSMNSLEHLTSNIRKLRASLTQAKEAPVSESSGTLRQLDEITRDAELVKTALGSALTVSWSGEGDIASSTDVTVEEDRNPDGSSVEKIDAVTAAGFEMVELLVLAAQMIRSKAARRDRRRSR